MNRKAVAVLVFGLFVSVLILYSSSYVELVGSDFSIKNLSVTFDDGNRFILRPSFPGSFFLDGVLNLLYGWFKSQGSQSIDINEGWESGSLNGWSLHDSYFSSYASGSIKAGVSTYTANTGTYSARIYGDLTFSSSYQKAYSYFSININEDVTSVSVSYYMYTKEYASGSASTTKTYVEGRLYIKIYNYTSGSIQTLWGPYERDSPSWRSYSKQWTFSDVVKLVEVGFRAYFYGGSISGGPGYLDGWVYIDDVSINYEKVAYVSVSQFKVTCDYSISGKYVKASANADYDSVNYTLSVYHQVDGANNWVYAYSTDTFNASLPVSVTGWSSGWLSLLTGSYTDGIHNYYIKVQIDTAGYSLNNTVISDTTYAILQLQLKWQNTWLNPSNSLRLVEAHGLTPRVAFSSEGLTAFMMIFILTLTATYLVYKREELD